MGRWRWCWRWRYPGRPQRPLECGDDRRRSRSSRPPPPLSTRLPTRTVQASVASAYSIGPSSRGGHRPPKRSSDYSNRYSYCRYITSWDCSASLPYRHRASGIRHPSYYRNLYSHCRYITLYDRPASCRSPALACPERSRRACPERCRRADRSPPHKPPSRAAPSRRSVSPPITET